MQLVEGTFIKRIQILFAEGLAISWRALLNVCGWLDSYDADYLNRVVLYISVWGDYTSSFAVGDALGVRVKSFGREQIFQFIGVGRDTVSMQQQKEFTLATIGNPSSSTEVLLSARALAWLATETHRFIIEVQAYLLDEMPTPVVERLFV